MRVVVYVLFACCASARGNRVKRGAFSGKSLYKSTDPIVQLDNNNFDSIVLKSETAFLVEFYKDWCGHCRNFKPIFLRFANDVKNWDNVVKVAVINCASEENVPICDANRVHFVPFIKYFSRGSKNYHRGVSRLQSHRSAEKLRTQLTESLLAEYDVKHYVDWPKFDYIRPGRIKALWDKVPSDINKLSIVFDASKSSTVGAQFLLDLSKWNSNWVNARRSTRDHPLVKDLSITDFPSVALFQKGKSTPVYVSDRYAYTAGSIRDLLLDDLMKYNPDKDKTISHVVPSTALDSRSKSITLTSKQWRSKYYASETDLLLSIWYALYEEVPSTGGGKLKGKKLQALRAFVDILQLYYPRSSSVRRAMGKFDLKVTDPLDRSGHARKVFKDLYKYLSSHNEVKTAKWRSKFRRAERRHGKPFPKDADWDHCRGSEAEYRGFTCGMWMNFHTLTVHSFLEDGKSSSFKPLKVLRGIQAWVNNFFSCRHCAQHFMAMTTETFKMEESVSHPSDVIMYLWRAHNLVNRRLHEDVTEDPIFPKRQFPAKFLCKRCKSKEWSTRRVMKYLLEFYTDIRPHTKDTQSESAGFRTPEEKVEFLKDIA